jgi:hypothetical protein
MTGTGSAKPRLPVESAKPATFVKWECQELQEIPVIQKQNTRTVKQWILGDLSGPGKRYSSTVAANRL